MSRRDRVKDLKRYPLLAPAISGLINHHLPKKINCKFSIMTFACPHSCIQGSNHCKQRAIQKALWNIHCCCVSQVLLKLDEVVMSSEHGHSLLTIVMNNNSSPSGGSPAGSSHCCLGLHPSSYSNLVIKLCCIACCIGWNLMCLLGRLLLDCGNPIQGGLLYKP